MCGAFFVVQKLGKELVENTTHQRARDYGAAELMLIHNEAQWSGDLAAETVEFNRRVLGELRNKFLNDDIEFEVLGLKDTVRYNNLPAKDLDPERDEGRLLAELETRFRLRLAAPDRGGPTGCGATLGFG